MTIDGFLTVRHAHKIYIHSYIEDQIKAFIIGMISFKNKVSAMLTYDFIIMFWLIKYGSRNEYRKRQKV